ncbi:MAG: EutN/CcmL family microcompartment protein [Opitutaceae bacterium]
MRAGRVIGTVTMSDAAPQFRGARWIMVCPMGAEELTDKNEYGYASSPVVYDKLGAGIGDAILYVEGAEAMQPFDKPIPLDAITVALLDTYQYTPPTQA